MRRSTEPENQITSLCDVRRVRNVRNSTLRRAPPFRARAARLIAEARANQSCANSAEQRFRTNRTVRTSHEQLDAFFERVAVLEVECGLSREDAERRAAQGIGGVSHEAFFAAVVADWRRRVETAGSGNHDVQRLIDSGVLFDALAARWDELSIWAVGRTEPGGARTPIGLVSRLNGRFVVSIDRHAARLCDGSVILKPIVDARRGAALLWEINADREDAAHDAA